MENRQESIEQSKRRVKAWLDAAIEEDMLANDGQLRRSRWPGILQFVAGAAVAAILTVAILLPGRNKDRIKTDAVEMTRWTEVYAAYGEKKQVSLPDGSTIWIHNDSRVSYPDRFEPGKRQIFLSGEVFASISHEDDRPFIISSNGINVVVKGTTFNFRSYPESSEVELALIEGAVTMQTFVGGVGRSIEIEPGELVKASVSDEKVSHYRFDPAGYVSWVDMRVLYFNDETLSDIVAEMQRQFGISIEVKSQALLGTRYYASFVNGETPMQILNALNSTGLMRIQKKGNTYYIYPNN